MKHYRKGLTAVVDSVAKRLKLYLRRHHCCYCCKAVHVTPCEARLTASQLAWWRTVSLGTYWYCCSGILVYTYSSVVVLIFFVSAIETLIVVARHVLFVTTVWISENELRESINIYSCCSRAEVQQKSSYSPTMTS